MRDLPLFRRSSKGSPESWDEELPVALLDRRGVSEGTSLCLRFPTPSRISKNAPVADAAVLLRRRVTALTDMGNENGQLRESQLWGNSSKEAAKTNREAASHHPTGIGGKKDGCVQF